MKKAFAPDQHQPESFAFNKAFMKKAKNAIAKYPKGKQQSAVMPLLDLAQRQVAETGPYGDLPTGGGWIPTAAMNYIAELLDMPRVKVYEAATFYSMYNMAPVGKYLVQLCTTTPCWLSGSSDLVKACTDTLKIGIGETTKDGLFTLMEVECLGACVNAPMIQINDHYYEDLTADRMKEILALLKDGKDLPVGSQIGRKCSMSAAGPTSLEDLAKKHKIAS